MSCAQITRSLRIARGGSLWRAAALTAALELAPVAARASFLSGAALDTAADVLTWIVLFVAPIVGIGVFLLIHILPEKIAEKKAHPQLPAIKTLCLLSLVFGGMLWPLAWLWAYTKPVFHKIAYGVDEVPHDAEPVAALSAGEREAEIERLRSRLADLEAVPTSTDAERA